MSYQSGGGVGLTTEQVPGFQKTYDIFMAAVKKHIRVAEKPSVIVVPLPPWNTSHIRMFQYGSAPDTATVLIEEYADYIDLEHPEDQTYLDETAKTLGFAVASFFNAKAQNLQRKHEGVIYMIDPFKDNLMFNCVLNNFPMNALEPKGWMAWRLKLAGAAVPKKES